MDVLSTANDLFTNTHPPSHEIHYIYLGNGLGVGDWSSDGLCNKTENKH